MQIAIIVLLLGLSSFSSQAYAFCNEKDRNHFSVHQDGISPPLEFHVLNSVPSGPDMHMINGEVHYGGTRGNFHGQAFHNQVVLIVDWDHGPHGQYQWHTGPGDRIAGETHDLAVPSSRAHLSGNCF
jgi:hypothetical protein